jgi:hypothetical protein
VSKNHPREALCHYAQFGRDTCNGMEMYKEQTDMHSSLHKHKFKKYMHLLCSVQYKKILPPFADYHSWHGCLMVPYKDSPGGEKIYIDKIR